MLPTGVKSWLDRALVEGNFSGYQGFAEELKSRGYDVSKSAVQRYGAEFEERLSTLKMSSEQARAVVASAPDEEGAVNEALMRLVQEHLFNLLMAKEGKFDLPKVARAVADLGRATVTQKKWQTEVRDKTRAAADAVTQVAKKGGLTAEAVDTIRREILGIAA